MKNITIGIITMYRKNYGAFYQALALEKMLLSLGYSPELIRYDYHNDNSFRDIPLSVLRRNPVGFFKKVAVSFIRNKDRKNRSQIFDNSIERCLLESDNIYKHYKFLKDNPPFYDIYLTGSDQVFNPYFTPHANSSRLLEFASGIKVSYAASAGTISFSNSYKQSLIENLKKFSTISVREEELKTFLEPNLLGKSIVRNVDPTLLLSCEQWSEFAIKPEGLTDKYIFYYQVSTDNGLFEATSKMSEVLQLPVYTGDGYKKFKNQIQLKSPYQI
ncbi:MAG: polysaccharide pyruvyl transferase family protein [Candidatus Izemoplasmatales bacterium]